jgi:hypothetical protein
MRVMLRYNVEVSHGLVNSATGYIVGFGPSITDPIIVYVQFDHLPNPVPIKRQQVPFTISAGVEANISQFPLISSWAFTIHKVFFLIKNKLSV